MNNFPIILISVQYFILRLINFDQKTVWTWWNYWLHGLNIFKYHKISFCSNYLINIRFFLYYQLITSILFLSVRYFEAGIIVSKNNNFVLNKNWEAFFEIPFLSFALLNILKETFYPCNESVSQFLISTLLQPIIISCCLYLGLWHWERRWEFLGTYPVFTMVMVIYHYVERILKIVVTANVLYNIYNHKNILSKWYS